jgi:hypothetical protein
VDFIAVQESGSGVRPAGTWIRSLGTSSSGIWSLELGRQWGKWWREECEWGNSGSRARREKGRGERR